MAEGRAALTDDEVLRAVAVLHLGNAGGLGGRPRNETLVHAAESARLLGPLYEACIGEFVELTDAAKGLLIERLKATMLWCLHLEARLLELRAEFAAAGEVDALLLKGSAIAHLDEDDPILRSSSDIDLLVRAEHMDRAVSVLERLGATRPWPQRRRGFDRRFAKSVTMTMPDGVEVDLHRSLCDGVHGHRIPLPELFVDAEEFTLGGEQVGALCRPHRMLHAAYHAMLGSGAPGLLSLRDLAGYLSAPDLGPDRVVPIVERWRGEGVLQLAVLATIDALPVSAPAWQRWAETTAIDPAEQAIIDRQRREGSSFGPAKVDLWRELGPRDKVAYATALLWPSAEHLSARQQRRSDPLRAVLRSRG
jgi:hypothetical protein